MKIQSKAYGTVEVDESDIITFEQGLIGLEQYGQYAILNNRKTETLAWLQSLEEEHLAFVIIQPQFFKPDYKPEIRVSELAKLDIDDPADLIVFAIVVVPEDVTKMTANLKAPVIINTKNRKAKQLVLNDDKYLIKEPVFAKQ